ncbi:SDR family NAD(P)-dependent oxidoreductase [Enemella sp. A6]|uniref:SDR family NAD(P)-dependent oxidoreductase n=1 Tax=Enemella sp. A6 TaxID=3440152 RepID=UPI003EC06330
MARLDGQAIFITGAGSGLGAATAELGARERAKVACLDQRLEVAEHTAARVQELGSEAFAVEADVTNFAQMARAAEQATEALGPMHGVVASAGISSWNPSAQMPEEQWDQMIAVNLKGVWLASKFLIEGMQQLGGGSIVNIASVAGLVGLPGIPHYAAAKGGVVSLTRQLAVDYGPDGIRVNAICPGEVPTPMLVSAAERHARKAGADDVSATARQNLEAHARDYPLGRLGRPDDIASMAVMLLSAESEWVTGQSIAVDGGFTTARGGF